jgi:hypothetical protein
MFLECRPAVSSILITLIVTLRQKNKPTLNCDEKRKSKHIVSYSLLGGNGDGRLASGISDG